MSVQLRRRLSWLLFACMVLTWAACGSLLTHIHTDAANCTKPTINAPPPSEIHPVPIQQQVRKLYK